MMSNLGKYMRELALTLREAPGGSDRGGHLELLQWHSVQLNELTAQLRRLRRRDPDRPEPLIEPKTDEPPRTEPESAPVVLLGGGGGEQEEPEDHQPPQVKRSRSE